MSEILLSARKRYVAGVTLGVETDTYDADGTVLKRRSPSGITKLHVQRALKEFTGLIDQVPPMFSAIKRSGKPLYKLARAGITVDRKPRRVEVYALALTAWQSPFFRLEIECGSGTYIRSIAHDLGTALGCGAHLHSLCRTQVGRFSIDDALSLEELFDAAHGGYLGERLYPMDWVATHLPVAILDTADATAVEQGRLLPDFEPSSIAGTPNPGEICRAYAEGGELKALLIYDGVRCGWQPQKVFSRDSVD